MNFYLKTNLLVLLCLLCLFFNKRPTDKKGNDGLSRIFSKIDGSYRLKQCDHRDLPCYGLSKDYTSNFELAKDHSDPVSIPMLAEIVQEYKFGFGKYKNSSFGYDEFHPLTKDGEMFTSLGVGYFIVDVVDTAILMGLEEETETCFDYIKNKLTYKQNASVNVFETTIRVLGGLLSSYFLTGYQNPKILNISLDLGDRLFKAFNDKTGITIPTINLLLGNYTFYEKTSTAEATSIQLEFKLLSFLTNNTKFWDISETGMDTLNKESNNKLKVDGLVPIIIDSISGEFETNEIRLGSRGDSYYEYLLKQYLLTQLKQPKYLERYNETVRGIKDHLVGYSMPNHILFIGEIFSNEPYELIPKMDHLVCFLPGNLALGATRGYSLEEVKIINEYLVDEKIDINLDDLKLAKKLMRTCYKMYTMHPTGLAAEITKFNTKTDFKNKLSSDMFVTGFDKHCLLRPETVESLFIMYRITGDKEYRKWGWSIFKKIKEHAKTQDGYCSVEDVTRIPTQKINKMETFFLSETLKYLYLLFSDTNFMPLHQIVFNTEAHLFPRFDPEHFIKP